jgi:hypothetical protein
MRKRQELKTQRKRKHKEHVARTPEAVAKYKARFLKQLALGQSPGVAARNVGIARSTAYGWKKEDQEFDAAWVDAVETALDALETQLYDSALAGNSSNAQFILKHRRREVYGNVDDRRREVYGNVDDRRREVYGNVDDRPQQPDFRNIPLEEHIERLKRLGLPVPVIESDEGDFTQGDPTDANHS